MTGARSKYRFKFWGRATVIDPNTIELDDGSANTIKVIAPGHTGIGDGDFASAVGTLTTSAEEAILLSSSSQVSALDRLHYSTSARTEASR